MVEKGFARSGQLDAMNAARQQLGPDLVLQIANLPTQRGLSRCLNSIAIPCLRGMPSAYKVFFMTARRA